MRFTMRKMVRLAGRCAGGGVAVMLFAGAMMAQGGDWPLWRGPQHDGVSTETGLVNEWSVDGRNLVWRADFIGRSTPVVFDGRVCVMGRVGEGVTMQERVACYDAGDGRLLWEDRFNVYNTTVPFNRAGWASLGADPATGYVYANGVAGRLNCYDRDGKIVWTHFLTEDVGYASGYGGRTQSPIIEGDQLILSFVSVGWGAQGPPSHRVFAFDKRTGEQLWVSTPGGRPYDMNTQSVVVTADMAGQRMLLNGNADGWIYALKAYTGEKVWGFQLSKRGINSNVLPLGDRACVSHSEENLDTAAMGRMVCIDATGTGEVTSTHEVWRNDRIMAGFASPTHHDGVIYQVDNSANLFALEAATGKVLWEHSLGTVGKGSPVWADGKLYATEVNGRFHILKVGREGVQPLDSDEVRMPEGRYAEIYGSAAVAYGRVYFATENGLFCLGDKSKPMEATPGPRPAPAPKGEGPAAWLQVVPAEVLIAPGGTATFQARAYDAKGRALGVQTATWSLDGLKGVLEGGAFTAEAGTPFQAGQVKATSGSLVAAARVRVIAPLPWSEDFESYEEGGRPATWVTAGTFAVEKEGDTKVLVRAPRDRGLDRSTLYMGPSTMKDYTLQVDVMSDAHPRRRADIGVVVSGYTMDLQGVHQKIQVRSWPSMLRMAQETEFPWEAGTWYTLKMRVDSGGDKAVIRGKVWPRGQPEPEAWTITVEDPLPIRSGSPGLVAYSPVDVHFDNLKVTVNQ